METLFPLIGVVVGFGLSECAQWMRDHFRSKRRSESVRMLVRTEVEHNLRLARELHQMVIERPIKGNRDQEQTVRDRLRFLLETPLPPWNQHAFTSQLGELPDALRPEQIEATQRHYGNLDALSQLYRTANNLQQIQQAESIRQQGSYIGMAYSPLFTNSERIWSEYERRIHELEIIGNPLD